MKPVRIVNNFPNRDVLALCQRHAERAQRMRKVFCWLPTPVYLTWHPMPWRDGFRWLRFVWRDSDGRHYTSPLA